MLSLLKWTLGTANDPLTAKQRIQAEQTRPARAQDPGAMPAAGSRSSKRKRVDSVASAGQHQRAHRTKKASPQYLSHVEVAASNRSSAAPPPEPPAERRVGDSILPPTPTALDTKSASDVDIEMISAGSTVHNKHADGVDPAPSGQPSSSQQASRDPSKVAEMQQVIETQFNLEILLKHNELRLIDQEIAKCQIAMEQLRRCSLIPYPSMTGNADDMVAVSSGIGPSLAPKPGVPPAQAPPPWGVTDGPYSRHYAAWLLADPMFDGGHPYPTQPQSYGPGTSDIKTRGGRSEKSIVTPKYRTHRSSGSVRLQALPAGYPEPKEDKGPMILKRASDGKMVKLVCIDCKRENFNSAQGFINHCRIAHSRNLPSHEAAAQACGQDLDISEAVALPHPEPNPPAASGLVHPLIRSSTIKPSNLSITIPTHLASDPVQRSSAMTERKPPSSLDAIGSEKAKRVVPDPAAPHLSRLFAATGQAGDFHAIIKEALIKEDFDTVPSEDEPSSNDGDSDFEADDADDADDALPSRVSQSRLSTRVSTRGPATSTSVTSNRPTSRKGPERATRQTGNLQPHLSSVTSSKPSTSASSKLSHHIQTSDSTQHATAPAVTSPIHDLSPHTTAESNNAPSLVSDDDDDDDDEDEEEDEEDDEEYTDQASDGSSESQATGEDGRGESQKLDVDAEMDVGGHEEDNGDNDNNENFIVQDSENSDDDDATHHHRHPRRGAHGTVAAGATARSSADPELSASSKARHHGVYSTNKQAKVVAGPTARGGRGRRKIGAVLGDSPAKGTIGKRRRTTAAAAATANGKGRTGNAMR